MVYNHRIGISAIKSPMAKSETKKSDVELRSDSWSQFERAVDAAVKSGPRHKKSNSSRKGTSRPLVKAKERPASKGRVHKGKTRA